VFSPLLMKMLSLRSGQPLPMFDGFSGPQIILHFDHIADKLADNIFILGDAISGADFGLTYMISMGELLGLLENHPTLAAILIVLDENPRALGCAI
jgi:glutathione S-transferase